MALYRPWFEAVCVDSIQLMHVALHSAALSQRVGKPIPWEPDSEEADTHRRGMHALATHGNSIPLVCFAVDAQ